MKVKVKVNEVEVEHFAEIASGAIQRLHVEQF